MYTLVIMGGYIHEIFERCLAMKSMALIGCVVDYSLPDDEIEILKQKIRENNISELVIEDIPNLNPSMVFLCNYTKIVKSELIHKHLFVNIHAGILPKWRGFNSNCWAILNGEKEIGYTIHKVNENFDDGDIYTIIKVTLEENEGYFSGRNRIREELLNNMERIFAGIVSGRILGEKQASNGIVYNCKLRPSDGEIRDWNNTTEYINGLFRVFGVAPYGTGVHIFFKGEKYSVLKMEPAKGIAQSIGVPGSVVNILPDKSVMIKTKDTAVVVKKLMNDKGDIINPGEIMKIGMRI